MQCLPAPAGLLDVAALGLGLAMDVLAVEVRIDGVCAACRTAAAHSGPVVDAEAGTS